MNDMVMTTPDTALHDLGRALQDTALLAHVKISVWDGMKSDKTIRGRTLRAARHPAAREVSSARH